MNCKEGTVWIEITFKNIEAEFTDKQACYIYIYTWWPKGFENALQCKRWKELWIEIAKHIVNKSIWEKIKTEQFWSMIGKCSANLQVEFENLIKRPSSINDNSNLQCFRDCICKFI